MLLFWGYEVVIGEVTFRGEPAFSIVGVEGAVHILCRTKHHVSKLAPTPPFLGAIGSQIIFTRYAVYR